VEEMESKKSDIMKRILFSLLLLAPFFASAQTENFKWIKQQVWTASGTNTYTVSMPGMNSYVLGFEPKIRFTNANTGAATLQVGVLAAIPLKKNGGVDLVAGDIPAGATFRLSYDGTNFQVLGIGGTGGGGALTFSNGLTELTGDVKLGGQLLDDTFINTNGYIFSIFDPFNSLSFSAGGIQLGANTTILDVNTNGLYFSDAQDDGDLLYAYGVGIDKYLTKLAIGTPGQVLTVSSGLPAWVTPTVYGDMFLGTSQTVTAAKTFNTGTFSLRNPANTFSYNFLGSAIVANRTVTLPLLTGNDTFVFELATQTFNNKTFDLTANTLAGVKAQFDAALSDGDFLYVGDVTSNATHTGDVTGATALTIAAGAVDIPMLSATGTPSGSTYLRGDNTWATVSGGSGDVVGPASAVDGEAVVFDGTTGKLVKRATSAAKFPVVGLAATTFGNNEILYSTGVGNTAASSSSLTWNGTTLNATQFNGVALTAAGSSSNYLREDGTYGPPAGGGDMILASAQTSTGKKTFQADATNAGINLGSGVSNPSVLTTGDMWTDGAGSIKERNNATTAWAMSVTSAPATNHIPYATNTNLYTQSSGFTFDGTTLTVPQVNGVALTAAGDGKRVLLNNGTYGEVPITRTNALVIEADFYTDTSPYSPSFVGAAISGGTDNVIAGEANHPGIIDLRDGTTANGGWNISTAANAFLIAGGERSVITFQIRNARATANGWMGFRDNTTNAQPVDGAYVYFVGNGTTVTMDARTRSNSTETINGTTWVPTLNTWYTLVITVNAGATQVNYEVFNDAGASQWAVNNVANIPTGAGRQTGFGIQCNESTTDAAAAIMYLDYVRMEINRTLVR